MIDISSEQLKTVNTILTRLASEYEVRAFGSRVCGGAKPYSDLDLVLVGDKKLTIRKLGEIREAFQESQLPFRVDIMDWQAVSDSFRKIIEQKYEVIQKPGRDKIEKP